MRPAPWTDAGVWWLSSGRDAYLLAARLLPGRRWLVPKLICPVVIDILRIAGATCAPYRAGQLSNTLTDTDVVVLVWDPLEGPNPLDQAASAKHATVIEDRCLWAGLPTHVESRRDGCWVIGSCRKWLGGLSGGWLMGPSTKAGAAGWTVVTALDSEPLQRMSALHSLAVHAAGAVRRIRPMLADLEEQSATEQRRLEDANLLSAEIGEASLGSPGFVRPQLLLDRTLIAALGDATDERECRASVARSIQTLFAVDPTAGPGVTGIRVHAAERDACLKALREVAIYAPVHWRDGNWSGSLDAARLARDTFTLPCPAGAPDDYLRRLEPIIRHFALRTAEPWS